MTFRVGWIDDPEGGFQALVLHDAALDETLEVQRGDEDTEQDRALGQDTYCLVRNGAATSYGGVDAFSVSGPNLVLTLTREAAATLSLPRVVEYDLDDEGRLLVAQRLHGLLA